MTHNCHKTSQMAKACTIVWSTNIPKNVHKKKLVLPSTKNERSHARIDKDKLGHFRG